MKAEKAAGREAGGSYWAVFLSAPSCLCSFPPLRLMLMLCDHDSKFSPNSCVQGDNLS